MYRWVSERQGCLFCIKYIVGWTHQSGAPAPALEPLAPALGPQPQPWSPSHSLGARIPASALDPQASPGAPALALETQADPYGPEA